jgi:polar amino acid transport system substrate-binding protein
VAGSAVELVRQAFDRMGETVTVQVLPWPRVLRMVQDGEADGFFTSYRLPERERWADFCKEELAPQEISLFKQKAATIAYHGDLAQLSGLSIGVVSQVSYGVRFDRELRNGVFAQVAESVDGETNFRQLLSGRVDLVASNRLGAKYILARMGRTAEVAELGPPLERLSSYLAFSKRRQLGALRDRFDRELRRMKADGTWARILKRGAP